MSRFYIAALLVVCLACSCDKEDRKNTYADQEALIDNYISSLSTDYSVTINSGVARVTLQESTSGKTLTQGDSMYFHYSGYVFSSGKGELFSTNDTEVAEMYGFVTDGKPFGIKYGSSALIEGLNKGFEGVGEGEHCYIVFSSRYGYGNHIMGTIPKLTPLFFEIKVDKIVK